MRGALACAVVLLCLASEARADVFVPADPPARGGSTCSAAAGDIVVTGRQTGRSWDVRISEHGGPARRLAGSEGCPHVQVAADGTAALVIGGGDRATLVVRPPGGSFGAPLVLGEDVGSFASAVASGGWVAVAWGQALGEDDRLDAIVVAPGGTVSRRVLDEGGRNADGYDYISDPRLGLDERGTATVVWTHSSFPGGDEPTRLRIARSAGGGAWTHGSDLAPGNIGFSDSSNIVDVAVSPSGRTLLAWVADNGVYAALDSEPPRLVGPARGAGTPVAAVGDDGSALVAFGARGSRVFVAERPVGAGWAAAHSLVTANQGPMEENERDDPGPRSIELSSALGPSGAAAVAWRGADSRGPRLIVATGRVGGSWLPAIRISSPIRHLDRWSLANDPTGTPLLRWGESTGPYTPALDRGARLAPDAQAPPPDRQAPVVSARFPTRVPATSTGNVRIRVPVRCSEACDVRLQLGPRGFDVGYPPEAMIRTLPAGRATTLTVSTSDIAARALMGTPGSHRLMLELSVADAAGNVERRTRQLRVRVIARPLRSFKVAPDHEFGMFTRAGNRAVAKLVNSLIEGLASGTIRDQRELGDRYRAGKRALSRAGHDETEETEVRESVFRAMMVPCLRSGYDAEAMLG